MLCLTFLPFFIRVFGLLSRLLSKFGNALLSCYSHCSRAVQSLVEVFTMAALLLLLQLPLLVPLLALLLLHVLLLLPADHPSPSPRTNVFFKTHEFNGYRIISCLLIWACKSSEIGLKPSCNCLIVRFLFSMSNKAPPPSSSMALFESSSI